MLSKFGYQQIRQTGSHIRLSSMLRGNEHRVSIPDHATLKPGTLNSILMS